MNAPIMGIIITLAVGICVILSWLKKTLAFLHKVADFSATWLSGAR
jgi:hypothetical protein